MHESSLFRRRRIGPRRTPLGTNDIASETYTEINVVRTTHKETRKWIPLPTTTTSKPHLTEPTHSYPRLTDINHQRFTRTPTERLW